MEPVQLAKDALKWPSQGSVQQLGAHTYSSQARGKYRFCHQLSASAKGPHHAV